MYSDNYSGALVSNRQFFLVLIFLRRDITVKYDPLVGYKFARNSLVESLVVEPSLGSDDLSSFSLRVHARGSFSICYISQDICLRFTPSRLGEKFMRRLNDAMCIIHAHSLSCVIHSFGYVFGVQSNEVLGFAILMEKLNMLPSDFADSQSLFELCGRVSRFGFHNDMKLDNLMISDDGELHAIDFDYFSSSKICISVTSFQTIELDLSTFLQTYDLEDAVMFRTYYDLSYLSLSMAGSHPLYRKLLENLHETFNQIRASMLEPLLQSVGPKAAVDLPMEILVRCPGIDGVSVNLTDLRGNAFAHQQADWDMFPSLVKSRGVYWPT